MSVTVDISPVRINTKDPKEPTSPIEAARATLRGTGQKLEQVGLRADDSPHHRWHRNGFWGASYTAFQKHKHLILSPDDIWLAIVTGFGHHVANNAEALRERLAGPKGGAHLIYRNDEFVMGQPNPWSDAFASFSGQIKGHVGEKRHALLVGNFSTTGPLELACSELGMMSALKEFFTYEGRTDCGIPKVTLLGTPADWEDIYIRARALSEFDLDWWWRALEPALVLMKETSQGQGCGEAWHHFFQKTSRSGIGHITTGWIIRFFPYVRYRGQMQRNTELRRLDDDLAKSRYGIGNDFIPPGCGMAPLRWRYYGNYLALRMYAGSFSSVEERPGEVRPGLGWIIAHDPTIDTSGWAQEALDAGIDPDA